MKRSITLACLLLFGAVAPLPAQLQLRRPVGFVNDFAGVIPQAQRDSIDRIVQEVRAKSGGEIVLVTLPSLGGRTPDEVALQIGRQWGVGRKGPPGDPARNTGVVVLIVPKETSEDGRGHLKIETGTGTTTFITAAQAGRIADQYMVPWFQRREYGTGALQGVRALAQRYAERFGFQLTGAVPAEPRPPPSGRGISLGDIIFWGIIIVIILAMLGGGRGGRGGRRRRAAFFPIFFPMGGGHRGGWG
ncbi:MAG: TPM domain-containing protein, partial [Gemmatimonadetes bacterium]|nr:TPM domain-containing protein [Gemmatimonadota bacterium]